MKKTLVEKMLDKAKIQYKSLDMNEKQEDNIRIYKTLALKGDKTGPIIGIVPLDGKLDTKKFASISNNKKVHMLPLNELEKTTGYVHGANNPVGIWKNKKFKIFIDNSALDKINMTVSAGELKRSLTIKVLELAEYTEAEFVDIQMIK